MKFETRIVMDKESFLDELVDKVKFMRECHTEFTDIDDIINELIESMKEIKSQWLGLKQ